MDATTYDFIVVGAGSAGCAVAARLSENSAHSVLLLEAGPRDDRLEIRIPAAFSKLFHSELDWDYDTEPQPQLNGRRIYWPRGKVLGGSSSINAMMWIRGFPEDYDAWTDAAGESWSWNALRPYFRRVERVRGASDAETGTAGAISIEAQRSPRSATAAFLDAARELGLDEVAANGPAREGVTQTMVNQRRGARFSAADGYLKPARRRRNLTVQTGSHATRVLFDGTRAVGVEVVRDGVTATVCASREVILSGGSVNTPHLLMLSGIGDRDELAEHGIPLVVHSPEVGKNLKDHLVSGLIIDADDDTLFAAERLGELAKYLISRTGMLTSNVAEAYGYLKSEPGLDLPDLELIFAPVAFIDQGQTTHQGHGLTIGAILSQPRSSGTVSLASANPLDPPRIDPRYLTDPDGRDRAALLHGLGVCEDLIASDAIGRVSRRRFIRPENADGMPRAERDALAIDEYAHTLYHPVGTARMGTDAASVVDEHLRVRGVEGLRVADASVMPSIIRGHTNAAAMVIGERAADLIGGARS
ncbi:GMC family oxidoreductase N-terminal domain-containing protein [Agromyces sp. H66]|uniref:GMC family oxidoreductase n=1 Tax=Agromyces sp. H66 TaxID=2529859 RepID=UPI0010AAD4BE|nr:GMC family oxidoreductase N-terminal domain-containing protein [Agromyces sp. H66]